MTSADSRDPGASDPVEALFSAMAASREALRLAPDDAVARARLAAAVRQATSVGARLHREGRLASAERLYRAVLEAEPATPDASQLLGLILHAAGDSTAAVERIRKAIALRSDVPWYHANLAAVYETMGRTRDALECYDAQLRLDARAAEPHARRAGALKALGRVRDAIGAWETAWALAPGDDGIYRQLWAAYQEFYAKHIPPGDPDRYVTAIANGNTARAEGRGAEAERLYLDAIALRPQAPFARTQLGSLLAAAGRLEEADAAFRDLARTYRYPNEVIRLDPRFVAALAPHRGDSRFPPMQGSLPAAGRSPVVLIAGDAAYFRLYGFALAHSVAAAMGRETALHVHVVNPDAWIEDEVRFLRAETGLSGISYTFERLELIEPAAGGHEHTYSVKTWYASARFLRLPELIERCARPFVMLDMDVIVLRDLTALIDRMGAADVATMRVESGSHRVWDEFWVTAVAARPTPGAHAFFSRVADYIRHFLARGKPCWGLDQIAFYAVHAWAKSSGAPIAFHWLPRFVAQGTAFYDAARARAEFDDTALLWTVTGSVGQNLAKRELPAYRAHLPRIRKAYGWHLPGTDSLIERGLASGPVADGRRVWEAALQDACMKRIARARRAVDAGAHVGFWSAMLARRFERVEAFEPHPLLQECFRRNVTAPHVTLHALALGAAPGTRGMVFEEAHTGMSDLAADAAGRVSVARLDDFGFADVDFMKIDADGYERSVLEGAERTLAASRPLIVIEQNRWSARYGEGPLPAVRFLESLGARVLDQPTDRDYVMGWLDFADFRV